MSSEFMEIKKMRKTHIRAVCMREIIVIRWGVCVSLIK